MLIFRCIELFLYYAAAGKIFLPVKRLEQDLLIVINLLYNQILFVQKQLQCDIQWPRSTFSAEK